MGLMSMVRMMFRVRSDPPTLTRPDSIVPTKSGPNSSEQAIDDLLFHPEDLTFTQAREKGSVVNTHEDTANLVFNPRDHTFAGVGTYVSNSRDKLLQYCQVILHAPARLSAALTLTRSVGLASLIILLAFLTYMTFWDSYSVNAKLLFLQRDSPAKEASALGTEVEMLRNLELTALFAGEVYEQIAAIPKRRAGGRLDTEVTAHLAKAFQTNFRSASELAEWLQRAISVNSEISNGVARVSLSIQGDDPELLKAVMDAYVSRYTEHRLMLESQAERQSRGGSRDHAVNEISTLIGPVSEQLQKIELQEHGCALALKLIDQGKGVFSGFAPDTGMAGTPSLAQFQEKIVQLEIKKRALEVQFTPNAREVRAVDLEIQGVKRAMRECLVEHLEFLKKGKERLLAQHDLSGLQKALTAAKHPNEGKSSFAPDSARPDSWILIRDGLYMLRDRPQIARKPLIVRAGNLKRSIMAYLSPTDSNKVVSKGYQFRKSSQRSTESTSGDRADPKQLANTGGGSRLLPATGSVASNVVSRQEDGPRVKQTPSQSQSNYWESVPASHFGRRSLW